MSAEIEVQVQAPWIDEAWNQFLLYHPHGHLLQTCQWAQFKSRYGWSASRVLVKEGGDIVAGAQVLFRDMGIATVAYVPKGPTVHLENQAYTQLVVEGLSDLCRKRKAIFLRLEPDLPDDPLLAHQLAQMEFEPAGKVQPRSTLILDISRSLDDVLAEMKSKTRYNIRLAERRGVTVREAGEDEVHVFYRLSMTTSVRDDFPIHEESYYLHAYRTFVPSGLTTLFLAEYQGEPIAGLMAFAFGSKAWYMYGASSNRHRNQMPNYLLQWRAIEWAKARGCVTYDFWGIPDEIGEDPPTASLATERSDGLWGVYRFKEGFGGNLVRYLGAYDRVYSPLLHRLGTSIWPWMRSALHRLRRRPLPASEVDVG